jgi:sulfate permease, SulP family
MPAPAGNHWAKDLLAGLVNSIISVPDGLASAALAGVNPVAGLYTSAVAPIAGGALISAQRMQIATTSAAALAAGEAIRRYGPADRVDALIIVTVLAGAFLVLFWSLRVGRLVKYVSQAVMTGFLIGVAVVLLLDQSAPLVGYDPPPGSEPFQFWSLLANLGSIHLPTLAIGATALTLAVMLARTRFRSWSSLVAMIVPTLLVLMLGWTGIRLVADAGGISGGLPFPRLPSLGIIDADLVLSALALAAIIGVQGAGVSQSIANLDGRPISVDRDLLAQGVANIAAGAFSGIPAGGSVGQTALNITVGARTRWSGIFGGLWMLAILLFLATPVGYVPMAVLAALMIIAGISAIDMNEARSIWAVGWPARAAAFVTFVATLLLSISVAILIGVLLSAVLSIISAANDVSVRWLRPAADGELLECDVPPELDADKPVIVLNVYGSLFFAGARTLAERLPKPAGAKRPVVILRVRGQNRAGATLVDVLDNYADLLAAAGGRLYLTGVEPRLLAPLMKASKLRDGNDPEFYASTERLGHSTRRAIEDAKAWRYSAESGDSAY